MDHRIRRAMQAGSFEKLSGDFEVDESFIGGLARFMHKNRKAKITGTGGARKGVVMGLLDRNTKKIRVRHVRDRQGGTVSGFVREHVQGGSYVYRDAFVGYDGLERKYVHQIVDHAETYVKGNIYERHRELLESANARLEGNLCLRRAIPSLQLSGRTGVPLQQPQNERRVSIC